MEPDRVPPRDVSLWAVWAEQSGELAEGTLDSLRKHSRRPSEIVVGPDPIVAALAAAGDRAVVCIVPAGWQAVARPDGLLRVPPPAARLEKEGGQSGEELAGSMEETGRHGLEWPWVLDLGDLEGYVLELQALRLVTAARPRTHRLAEELGNLGLCRLALARTLGKKTVNQVPLQWASPRTSPFGVFIDSVFEANEERRNTVRIRKAIQDLVDAFAGRRTLLGWRQADEFVAIAFAVIPLAAKAIGPKDAARDLCTLHSVFSSADRRPKDTPHAYAKFFGLRDSKEYSNCWEWSYYGRWTFNRHQLGQAIVAFARLVEDFPPCSLAPGVQPRSIDQIATAIYRGESLKDLRLDLGMEGNRLLALCWAGGVQLSGAIGDIPVGSERAEYEGIVPLKLWYAPIAEQRSDGSVEAVSELTTRFEPIAEQRSDGSVEVVREPTMHFGPECAGLLKTVGDAV